MSNVPTVFSQDYLPGNVKKAMTGVSSGDLWKVPVGDLHVMPGLNVRTKNAEYDEHIERTAKSIFNEGFYPDKALAVFIDSNDRICIRDGHTRYAAVLRAIEMGAQITTIPCVTAPKGTSMVDITVGLVKSNTGKPLLPIEVAVVCKRLVGWGQDVATIAERLDYTPAYINDLLGLLEAPAALQALVSAGKVSASTAIKTSKKEGVAKATETLVAASNAAVGGKVSAKTLKAAAAPGEYTVAQLTSILKSVLGDKSFNQLTDKVQSKVLDVVG